MTHSDSRANRDLSAYLDLALRLANLFPAVLDFETGEISPDPWDEVVGNPPGTTPPRLEAWEAAIHPDDRPARDASWADCLAGRAPLHQAEYRVRRHDGRWVWIMVVGKVVERDAGGRPLRLALAVRNIDDLRQAEQQLRERERQLESLMGHLPGLAYRALADEHWTALFASKGIEDLTGYPADEFTSRRLNYADIMLPEDRPATREAVFTALRERRMYEAEHRIRHKDGSVRWIWARGHGVFAPDGSLRFIEGLNLDMTRQKQAEEELRPDEQYLFQAPSSRTSPDDDLLQGPRQPLPSHQQVVGDLLRPERSRAGGWKNGLRLLRGGTRPAGIRGRTGDPRHRPARDRQGGKRSPSSTAAWGGSPLTKTAATATGRARSSASFGVSRDITEPQAAPRRRCVQANGICFVTLAG